MKIPNKLKVGVKEFEVRMVDHLDSRAESQGVCSTDHLFIEIDNRLPQVQKEITFLHEIIHACSDFIGLQDDERLDEESICSRYDDILYTVLKENNLLN